MSRLTLPPGMYPAPTGDGKTAVFPKSDIPADLKPARTGDGADHTDALTALRCLAGAAPWPEPAPASPEPAPEPAPIAASPELEPQPEAAPPEPAPRERTHLPYELVDGTPRYLHLTHVDDGTVATTADGQLLARTDERGKPILDTDGNDELIWVDDDGYETVPPGLDPDHQDKGKPGRLSRLFNLAGSRGHSDTDDTPEITYYDENGVPIRGFDVVPPGAPPVSNTRKAGKRIVYAAGGLTALLTVSGLIFGVALGSSRVPAEGAISSSEAAEYGLSKFPVDSASSFASRYLDLCLTHGDQAQMQNRSTALETMAGGNVSNNCGWQTDGSKQNVDSVSFNGFVDQAPGYDTGQAAYLGYDVVVDGEPLAVSVPVWVGPTEGGGIAMQIVGDLGMSPTIPVAQAPAPSPDQDVDQQLGGNLSDNVVEPFLTAWAASNTRQMNLLTSREASTNVRNGLDGTLTRPKINTVVARPDKATTAGQPTTYVNGDTAVVDVAVTWTMASSEATQKAGYRIYVVQEADRWLVYDIQNGMIDASATSSNSSSSSTDAPSSSRSSGSSTSGGSSGGSDSGGLGSVDDLQSGDDSSSEESGTRSPRTP